MKVFISYGALPDQVTALRLQALGSAHGLTLYVPPAHTRNGYSSVFDSTSQVKLVESEVVLGVLGAGLSEMCRQELNVALQMRKNVMVMASAGLATGLAGTFSSNLVIIDPANPGAAEQRIVQWLAGLHGQQQGAKNAFLALGVLAVGLVLLSTAKAE
jgi:hypothetical protein